MTSLIEPNANLMTNVKETAPPMVYKPRVPRLFSAFLLIVGLSLLMAVVPSQANAVVKWDAVTMWGPTVLEPGERGGVQLEVGNAGDETSTGWPTVEIALPPGVTFDVANPGTPWECAGAGDPQIVTCASSIAPLISQW